MISKLKTSVLGLLTACACQAGAAPTLTSPSTYSGLAWTGNISATGIPSSCNDLRLDATADFSNGYGITVSGFLNCPAISSSYVVYGAGILTAGNKLNLALTFGNGNTFICQEFVSLSGSCAVYNSSGASIGTATFVFK